MSKLLIAILAAACWLSASPQVAPQVASDDSAGVTVSLNGATLLHRAGVNYPIAAIQAGVRGTVSVQVKLDSKGTVSDAQVLSGPEEMRKAVLQSVLQWHFTSDQAGSTRVIQVAFDPPGADAVRTYLSDLRGGSLTPPPVEGQIRSIRVMGLSEQATAQLLATLPVHEGDQWNADSNRRVTEAMKAFDEHLGIRLASMTMQPSGAEVNLVIEARGAAVKVGGNQQTGQIVRKVPPVYPPLAKSAGVSGVVRLSVLIGKDGTVQDVQVLEGPPLLLQAARDAVMQWVYQPTMLNGNPTQVDTTVDINFTLNQ